MPSGWFYQNMLTFSRIFEEFTFPAVDERARRVFCNVSESSGRAVTRMPIGPYTVLARMLLPSLERAVIKSARMQSYVDSTPVACALERYRLANGKLPDTLATLVPVFLEAIPNDVMDGKPLRYRVNSDGGFVLYSVGWNNTDDGGEIALVKQKKDAGVNASQGDWVWQMRVK